MAILSAELPKEDNVRILFWKEGGRSTTETAQQLEWHRASIDRFIGKAHTLPSHAVLDRKKRPGRLEKYVPRQFYAH
jgi:hypothetical protein